MAFLTVSMARPRKSALLIPTLLLGYTPQLRSGVVVLRSYVAYAIDSKAAGCGVTAEVRSPRGNRGRRVVPCGFYSKYSSCGPILGCRVSSRLLYRAREACAER
jgi:hypothetical protein